MMKKNGFTLAEVLITLSIIGVVAALTLPSLNLGVQASKVGPSLRKFINTMSNANEMILANNQSNSLRSVYTADANGVASYMQALSGQIRGTGTANTVEDLQNRLKEYGPNNTIFERMTVTGLNGQNVDNDPIPIDNSFSIFNFDSGESMAIRLRAGNLQQRRANMNGGHRGVFADVIFDIDGFNTGVNKLGTDLFVFRVDNNGSVIPVGGSAEANAGYVNSVGFKITGWQNVNGIMRAITVPVISTSRNAKWNTGNDLCNANRVNSGVNCAGSVADNNWRVIYQY